MTPPVALGARKVGSGGGQAPDGPLSWSPQSGQAYYINDGESVNLFEWMAPLVGARALPTSSESSRLPTLLSLSSLIPKNTRRFHFQSQFRKHCPLVTWSWAAAAFRGPVLPRLPSALPACSWFMLTARPMELCCDPLHPGGVPEEPVAG